MDALKGELQTAINTANASLGEFDVALQNGIVATNIAAELQNLEEIYAPDLVSVKEQLKQAEIALAETNAQVDFLNRGLGETFATFTNLQTAYPTGDTKDHIVGANGHRYYWNDTAWADGGIYQAIEILDGSVGIAKMSAPVRNTLGILTSIADNSSLYNTKTNEYVVDIRDTGLAPVTAFMSNTAGVTVIYYPLNDDISVTTTGASGTLIEFIVSNADLEAIRLSGGLTYSYILTSSSLTATIRKQVYSVVGVVPTSIYDSSATIIPGGQQVVETFIPVSSIPVDAECLRIYVKQNTTYTAGEVIINSFYVCKGDARGLGHPTMTSENVEPQFKEYLDLVPMVADLALIKPQMVSGLLTSEGLTSSTGTFELVDGVVRILTKLAEYTGSHAFVYFPTEFQEITWKHSRDDDWIALGGDATHTTAIGLGNPWSIRLIDLGPTNGTGINITVPDKALVGDTLNLSWSGDTLVAKKNKNDGSGWQSWFTVNLLAYPSLTMYKIQKRFGAVSPNSDEDLMTDVIASPIGSISLVDRVSILEGRQTINTDLENPWLNKLWNAVGDSITQQGKYIPLVANTLGLTGINMGLSSSTIAVNNSYLQNKSVYERVAGINGNTAYADADIWTVFAAVNDWLYQTPIGDINSTDTTDFFGALKAIVVNILGRPNQPRLILFTPLQSNRNGANGAGVTMEAYRQAIKAVGDYYSVPVLDLYGIGGINPVNLSTFAPDGVHPTDKATLYYYTKIVSAIRNL